MALLTGRIWWPKSILKSRPSSCAPSQAAGVSSFTPRARGSNFEGLWQRKWGVHHHDWRMRELRPLVEGLRIRLQLLHSKREPIKHDGMLAG